MDPNQINSLPDNNQSSSPISPPPPIVPPPFPPAPLPPQGNDPLADSPPKPHWAAKLVAVLIILAAAGTAYAYYAGFFSPRVAPLDILKNSLQASLDVKSFSFAATSTGQVSNTQDNGLPASTSFTLTGRGAVDFHSPDNILSAFNLSLNGATHTATETGSVAIGLDTVSLQKNIYLKLNDFNLVFSSSDPKAATAQMVVGLVNGFASSLKDKWIQIDTGKSISTTTSSQYSLNDGDRALLRDYFNKMNYVKSVNQVGNEDINGIGTYRLKVTIQNSQDLVDIIQKISLEKQPQLAAAENQSQFDQQMKDLSQAVTQSFGADLWIGRQDFLIYKAVLTPIVVAETQQGVEATLKYEAVFGNYNQVAQISAPAGAVPLEELLSSMFGGMIGSSTPTKINISYP